MINNKTIAVVIPAYNEETQIRNVIETMPDFVDRIVVVNDCSNDRTEDIVKELIKNDKQRVHKIKNALTDIRLTKYNRADFIVQEQLKKEINHFMPSHEVNENPETSRIILINQLRNGGVGAAIARGYKWCKDHSIDCTAVMAGDGQMDPEELESICKPIIYENIDYVKGNRLIHRSAWDVIPKARFLGNSILSILTKIASGYWHVSDTQSGYTAISIKALNTIKLNDIYKRYGMPNDMLVKLNIAFCTLREVEIKPVYEIGEKSKMKVSKVILPIFWLLFRSFFKRLWIKYLFRDFHPIFFLYNLSFILGILALPYLIKIGGSFINGTKMNYEPLLAFVFLAVFAFQSLLFAMYMDIQDNERLYK